MYFKNKKTSYAYGIYDDYLNYYKVRELNNLCGIKRTGVFSNDKNYVLKTRPLANGNNTNYILMKVRFF